jgi:hypothetical protein
MIAFKLFVMPAKAGTQGTQGSRAGSGIPGFLFARE